MTFPEFFYYVKQPPIWQTLPESARREIRRAVKAGSRGNLGEARLNRLTLLARTPCPKRAAAYKPQLVKTANGAARVTFAASKVTAGVLLDF